MVIKLILIGIVGLGVWAGCSILAYWLLLNSFRYGYDAEFNHFYEKKDKRASFWLSLFGPISVFWGLISQLIARI